MSEKIYAALLRIYPVDFRSKYGEEALQLFRDRLRDEQGFLQGLRLWLDLFADFALSLPREYRLRGSTSSESSIGRSEAMPAFPLLQPGLPQPKTFCAAGVLALTIILAFVTFLTPINSADNQQANTSSILLNSSRASSTRSSSLLNQRGVPGPTSNISGARMKLTPDDRHRAVAGVISNMQNFYLDADVAQNVIKAVAEAEQNGKYSTARNGTVLAELLTAQLQHISHDQHISVRYQSSTASLSDHILSMELLGRYRQDMREQNCTIKNVAVLPDNIGYLRFDEFSDPSVCGAKVAAVMKHLNHVSAIIFDLRQNHGGDPKMVTLIASYLFNYPTHLNDIYNPRSKVTQSFWTSSPVAGNLLADKPVYVLTSPSTFSAAEEFSYDLQNLKRATIVGERTAGGAYMVRLHRIDNQFMIAVPFARPINPISKTDWEGRGVTPDVVVKSTNALGSAAALATVELAKNH